MPSHASIVSPMPVDLLLMEMVKGKCDVQQGMACIFAPPRHSVRFSFGGMFYRAEWCVAKTTATWRGAVKQKSKYLWIGSGELLQRKKKKPISCRQTSTCIIVFAIYAVTTLH